MIPRESYILVGSDFFFVIPTLATRVLFRPALLGPLGSDYGPKEFDASGQKVSPSLGLPSPAISLSPSLQIQRRRLSFSSPLPSQIKHRRL